MHSKGALPFYNKIIGDKEMELIDNTTKTLRDDLAVEIKEGSKLLCAAGLAEKEGLRRAHRHAAFPAH